MKVTSRKPVAGTAGPKRSAGRAAGWLISFAIYTLFLFLLLAVSFDSFAPQLERAAGTESTGRALRALVEAPGNYLRARTQGAQAPALQLDIKFKHMHRLHERRDRALADGVLIPTPDDWVPGIATASGRPAEVAIRLGGHLPPDFEGDKWTLDVEVADRGDVLGTRRFVLRAPSQRILRGGMLFLSQLEREGVLTPRHVYVDLTINGDHKGLMALEERPSRELLARQQRRGGAIVGFDDTSFWKAVQRNGSAGPFDSPFLAPVRAREIDRSGVSDEDSEMERVAAGLLRGFLDGRLTASTVFDVEETGRFLAVAELWEAEEAMRWRHLHFHYDPLEATLAPISEGVRLRRPARDANGAARGLTALRVRFPQLLLEDPRLRRAFVEAFARLAREAQDDGFLLGAREEQQRQLALLHREYPLRTAVDLTALVERASGLATVERTALEHFSPELGDPDFAYPQVLDARTYRDEDGPYLELANALPVRVRVTALMHEGVGYLEGARVNSRAIVYPIELPATEFQTRPRKLRIRYREPRGRARAVPVAGRAQVDGQEGEYAFRAEWHDAPTQRSPVPQASLEKALSRHRFLRWNAGSETLYALPGTWQVEGSLVVPEGLGLTIPAGTTLRFEPERALVARGPLVFLGVEDAPIVLEGPEGERRQDLWSGVVVLGSSRPSRWSHVVVRNTGGVDRKGWVVDAGVVFRHAPVEMEACSFEGDRSAASLELVHSTFTLVDVEIAGAAGTALQLSFSEGEVRGGGVADVGGSGLAVTDSKVAVSDWVATGVRGAALLASDRSRVSASGLTIENAGFAAVSRNGSRLLLSDSQVAAVARVPLLAHTDRTEFGPSRIVAEGNRIYGSPPVAVAQTGSRIRIDGAEVPSVDIDVASLHLGEAREPREARGP
ncbi:MAG: hypothetical protein O7G30_07205 [Proteobacteria bacterium]|nr:hypothetical protein [Pseudomonadota bacterium]